MIAEPPALYEPNASPQPCITATLTESTEPELDEVFGSVFTGAVPAGPAPTITGLSAHKGSAAGGTPITITGTDFAGVSAVHFGSADATDVKFNSDTSITADAPPGSGTVRVTVTTPNGTSPASGKAAKAKFKYKKVKK